MKGARYEIQTFRGLWFIGLARSKEKNRWYIFLPWLAITINKVQVYDAPKSIEWM